MTFEEFQRTLSEDRPPEGFSTEMEALWFDRKGEWDRAHALVQDEESQEAAWVHAYLHRKEGDLSNAGYWYRRCGKPVCEDTLENEWRRITEALMP